MRKLSLLLVFLLATLCVFAGMPVNETADANTTNVSGSGKETVKIGVILPLTGNNAYFGELCLNGVKLFKNDLLKREESGDLKKHYEIIIEDDQLLPRMTAEALNKFINVDHVSALITTTGGSGNVANPRAEQAKIIHFGVTSDSKVAKGTYNFTHWTQPEAETPLLVNLLKEKKLTRVAILTQRHQGTIAIANALKEELANNNIKPVFDMQYNAGERDFRVTLMRMEESKPNVFIPIGFSPESDIILRQQKQLKIDIETTTLEFFDLVSDKTLVEGKYFVSGAAETLEYKDRLHDLDPKLKPTYSGYFYDCLSLIVDAHEKNPNSTNLELAKWLTKIMDYPSSVGNGKLSIDKEGIIQTSAAYYIIKDGQMTQTTFENLVK